MKKNMKYFKRWLALLLAVVVVATTCIYAPDHFLRATDGGSDTEAEEAEPEVIEEELVIHEDEGEAETETEILEESEMEADEDPEADEKELIEEVPEEDKEKSPEAAAEETEEDPEVTAEETEEAPDEERPKVEGEEIEEESAEKNDESDEEKPAEDVEVKAAEEGTMDQDPEISEEDNEKIEKEEEQVKEAVPAGDEKITEEPKRPKKIRAAKAEDGAWVYVYIQLDGMEDDTEASGADSVLDAALEALGLTVNGHGWCTIGRTWIDGFSKAEDTASGSQGQLNAAINALSNIKLYNEGIDKNLLSQVTGWDLHGVETADGYDETGITWHLDGKLDLSKLFYTVTYDGNGAVNKMGEKSYRDPRIYPAGYQPVYAAPNQFIRENAEFAGWKMSDDTVGKLIEEGQTFAMPDHDVNLVAQWRELSINKTAHLTEEDGKPKVYSKGDTIEFSIDVTNTGDVSLENIKVTDMLEGAVLETGEGYTVREDGTAMIEDLAPGERVTVKASCEVTEDKIGLTDFVNRAKAAAGALEVEAATDPLPVEGVDKRLTVTKRIANSGTGEGGAFTAGDTVRFEITVTNTGDLTLRDVVVEDAWTDVVITGESALKEQADLSDAGRYHVDENGNAVIGTLAPNDSVAVTAEYVIRESDLGNADLRNAATASVPGDNEVMPASGISEPVPVEDKASDFSITKTIVDEKEEYAVGDVVKYAITVTNTGNVKLDHIVVTDILSIEEKQVSFDNEEMPEGITVDGNRATIAELPADMAVTLNCSYEVTREDVISGVPLSNSVIATGAAGANGPVMGPKGDTTPEVKLPGVYELVIHYVDANMVSLAPDVREKHLAGEGFIYWSPDVAGYVRNETEAVNSSFSELVYSPNYAFIRSDVNGMPAQDVEIFVIYTLQPALPPVVPPIIPGGNITPALPDGEGGGGTSTGSGTASETAPAIGVDSSMSDANADSMPGGIMVPATGNGTAAEGSLPLPDADLPQGGAVIIDEDGNVQIIPVTDPEVPLANLGDDPDSHECCALHFILLLVSMIVLGLYTHDRKKLQKKVFGLTGELEAEKRKRAR